MPRIISSALSQDKNLHKASGVDSERIAEVGADLELHEIPTHTIGEDVSPMNTARAHSPHVCEAWERSMGAAADCSAVDPRFQPEATGAKPRLQSDAYLRGFLQITPAEQI